MTREFKFIEHMGHRDALIERPMIALDLETTGLNPRKDSIVGASFCVEAGKGYYTTNFNSLFSRIQISRIPVIFHNLVFDYSFIKQLGFEFKAPLHDTMILADTIDPDRKSLGLKDLAVELLGDGANEKALEMFKWLEMNGLDKESIYKAPKDLLTAYAAEDAVNTFEIFLKLSSKIKEIEDYLKRHNIIASPISYYKDEQLAIAPVVINMQSKGVKLDLESTAKRQSELEARIKDLSRVLTDTNKEGVQFCEESLYNSLVENRRKKNITGRIKKMPPRSTFNWDSNAHLQKLFLNYHKLPITKKTKKGNPSVDADFLENIKPKFPWVEQLLELKELNKLTNTYLNNLLSMQEGGYIHANFHITGTATGRFSSSGPNLQNIPKHGGIKSLFVPDAGKKFIYADYSQLELRIAAHLSRDDSLIRAYTDGLDLHQKTADIIGTTRDKGKTLNFAIIYNASGWRVAEILGFMEGIPLCVLEPEAPSVDDEIAYEGWKKRKWRCTCTGCKQRKAAATKGDEVREKLFGQYQGLKNFVEQQKEFMNRYRIAISDFGKLRRLHGIGSDIRSEFNHAQKAGFNLPIQSFGASLCKRSMVSLHNQGFHIVSQIHDSILVQVPDNDTSSAQAVIKETMEGIAKLRVPLLVEPKVLCCFEDKACKDCGQIICNHRQHNCIKKEISYENAA